MRISVLLAVFGTVLICGCVNYAAGLFRYGPPLESVWWRYLGTGTDAALTLAWLVAWLLMRSRA